MLNRITLGLGLLMAGLISVACAGETETIIVEKQVIVEVPVEKIVEVPVIVEKEVIKEIAIERIVEIEVPVIKTIIKEIVVEVPVEAPVVGFKDADTVYDLAMVGQSTSTLLQWQLVEMPEFLGPDSRIAKESNGKINIKINTAPELGVGQFDVLRYLASGVLDLGMFNINSIAGDAPMMEGVDLAGQYPDMDGIKAEAGTRLYMPEMDKTLTNTLGIHMIGHLAFPAQVPYCKFAITGSADLKDKRVRTFGSTLGDYVEHFGGINLTIAFVDVYSAMQTGIADCAITGTGSGNSQKWYEVTTHLYTLPVGWSITGYGANVDMWNNLPTDVQVYLQGFFDEVTAKQWTLGRQLTQDGIDCNTGVASGCELGNLDSDSPMTEVVPSEADYAALAVAAKETVLPRWAERCGLDCKIIYNRTIATVTGNLIP